MCFFVYNHRSVPAGFTLGKLQLHHAKLVAENWNFVNDWPSKVPYIESLISNFEHRALFTVDDSDTPIGWAIQKPNCELGMGFVMEKYRRKGYFATIMYNIASVTLAKGFYPLYVVIGKNAPLPSVQTGLKPFGNISKYFIIS